ncbi:hypothetical protein QX776_04425 [Alteromonadaceae bacterium BrNp21-10]|nr:hypothetical protein [Alteromonadaceae bacterium BrNp21-10]
MWFSKKLLPSASFALASLISFVVIGQSNDSIPAIPQQVKISYVQHDAVINKYIPIIKSAYEHLGIDVSFVKVDIQRSLDVLNAGEVDADVIRSELVVKQNDNIRIVEPALGEMEVVLYCQNGLVCDESAMSSRRHILGLVGTLRKYHKLISEAKLSMVSFIDFNQMQRMFERGRIDYMINIIDPNSNFNHNIHIPHQTFNLYRLKTYHLVNKKLEPLLPQISQAIEQAQKEIMISYEP